jgi:hypothetical protein
VKKTGILILVLILALGALGIGYAAWSETLTIQGEASIGSSDIAIANMSATDNNAAGDDPGTFGVAPSTGEQDTITVTLANGYPGYVGTLEFDVVNATGNSIPNKIDFVRVDGTDYPGSPVNIDIDGDTQNDISVAITGLAVGADIPQVDAQVVVTVLDNATEGATDTGFEFVITIGGIQKY